MAINGLRAGIALLGLAVAPLASPAQAQQPTPTRAFVEEVTRASAIADPYKRCLHMPDLPGSHWKPEAVAAYCRFATEDTMTSARFHELIAAGKAEKVDKLFASYLDAQTHDATHPARFDAAIVSTGIDSPSTKARQTIDSWMHQRPQSVFAMAASGIQYHHAAAAARGAAYASRTTQAQMDAMRDLDLFARKDFDRAEAMSPAVPTMYRDMFATGVLLGDAAYAGHALGRGLALEPTNVGIRMTDAMMSGAKWGGSAAAVSQQSDDAAKLAIRTPLLWIITGEVAIAEATDESRSAPANNDYLGAVTEVAPAQYMTDLAAMADRAGNAEEAFILAIEALRFDNGEARALRIAANHSVAFEARPWVEQTLIRATVDHPYSIDVAQAVGAYFSFRGDVARAEPLLRFVLDEQPDNDRAVLALAQLYMGPAHRIPDALKLFDTFLEHHPDNKTIQYMRGRLKYDFDRGAGKDTAQPGA